MRPRPPQRTSSRATSAVRRRTLAWSFGLTEACGGSERSACWKRYTPPRTATAKRNGKSRSRQKSRTIALGASSVQHALSFGGRRRIDETCVRRSHRSEALDPKRSTVDPLPLRRQTSRDPSTRRLERAGRLGRGRGLRHHGRCHGRRHGRCHGRLLGRRDRRRRLSWCVRRLGGRLRGNSDRDG